MLPPKIWKNNFEINSVRLRDKVRPLLRETFQELEYSLRQPQDSPCGPGSMNMVDLWPVLEASETYFQADLVHPNVLGFRLLAEHIFAEFQACFQRPPVPEPVSTGSGVCTLYGMHELTFQLPAAASPVAGSPFFDLDAQLEVQLPTSSTVTADLFYDGTTGSSLVFRARVYCGQQGVYIWRLRASNPADLHGLSGAFAVVPATTPTQLPGKLRRHPDDKRMFAYDNGTTFLHFQDTGYRYVVDTEPYHKEYIDQAAAAGFTKIRVWFARHRHLVTALFADSRNSLDLGYWQTIDARLLYALRNHPQVIFELIPFGEDGYEVERYGNGDRASIGMVRYFQARFSALPNSQFCIVNDRKVTTDPALLDIRLVLADHVNRIGTDMAAREPWGTLLTSHESRTKGYSFLGQPWSTVTTLHDIDQVNAAAVEEYVPLSPDPVVNSEDRYEYWVQPVHRRYFFRRLFWANVLSFGHPTYGGIKTFEAFDTYGDPKGMAGYYSMVLRGVLERGAHDQLYMRQFFLDTGLSMVNMESCDNIVEGGADTLLYHCATNADHTLFIVYLANPSGTTPRTAAPASSVPFINLNLDPFPAVSSDPAVTLEGTYTARFFNPSTGVWISSVLLGSSDGGLQATAPGSGDWVLFFHDKALDDVFASLPGTGSTNYGLPSPPADLPELDPQFCAGPITLDTETPAGSSAGSAVIEGNWVEVTCLGCENVNGDTFLHDDGTGKGSKSVTFTPVVPKAGIYRVLMSFRPSSSRPDNTPVSVQGSQGTTQISVDQTSGAQLIDNFMLLGSFWFADANAAQITISNTGTLGKAIADAVRLECVAAVAETSSDPGGDGGDGGDGIFPDNDTTSSTTSAPPPTSDCAAGTSTRLVAASDASLTGPWITVICLDETGTGSGSYLHDGDDFKGETYLEFTTSVAASGWYVLSLPLPASVHTDLLDLSLASNTKVTVTRGTSTVDTVYLNQAAGESRIGVFYLSAGAALSVLVDNVGSDGHIVADVLRVVCALDADGNVGTTTPTSQPTTATPAPFTAVTPSPTPAPTSAPSSTPTPAPTSTPVSSPTNSPTRPPTAMPTESEELPVSVGCLASDEFILDTEDGPAAGVTVVGTWKEADCDASFCDAHGQTFLNDRGRNKGEMEVVYNFAVPRDGVYQVSMSYDASPSRSVEVPVVITSATGSTTVLVNQQVTLPSTKFFSLGLYTFFGGGQVRVTNGNTDGLRVIADAIKVQCIPGLGGDGGGSDPATSTPTSAPTTSTATPTRPPTQSPSSPPTNADSPPATANPTNQPTDQPTDQPTRAPTAQPTRAPTSQPTSAPSPSPPGGTGGGTCVPGTTYVLDTEDAPSPTGTVTVDGSWLVKSCTGCVFQGESFLQNNALEGKSVAFAFNLAAPGRYSVEYAYTSRLSRTTWVPINIDGQQEVPIDMRNANPPPAADGFAHLGDFDFGNSATITVHTEDTTWKVVADAVRLTCVAS